MPATITDFGQNLYLAPHEFAVELKNELKRATPLSDLILTSAETWPAAWAQDVWFDVKKIQFQSISEAAKALRGLGRLWHLTSLNQHRRAALIQEQLPKSKIPLLKFGLPFSPPNIGSWCLLDANTILASQSRWKKMPEGKMEFDENKTFPPTRAYLKLWEALTLMEKFPQPGESCFDMGSSPGGWTWVLQSLGANVTSVDKAELDPKIRALKNIKHLQESAFGVDPKKFDSVDWFCSDVICYPERLYQMVLRWLDSGKCKNMVCTVKLQGSTDFDAIQKFKELPNSQLIHLYHNKHELTWIYPARETLTLHAHTLQSKELKSPDKSI